MILALLLVLWLAISALGAAVPVGISAARQGREAGWWLVADAAARGGLAEAESGAWVAAAAAVPIGGVLSLPVLIPKAGVDVRREARRIAGDLWLLLARAELVGGGGAVLARSEQGLLVRVAIVPPDTVLHVYPTSRPWFRRPL